LTVKKLLRMAGMHVRDGREPATVEIGSQEAEGGRVRFHKDDPVSASAECLDSDCARPGVQIEELRAFDVSRED
jgi:hypothetical protein